MLVDGRLQVYRLLTSYCVSLQHWASVSSSEDGTVTLYLCAGPPKLPPSIRSGPPGGHRGLSSGQTSPAPHHPVEKAPLPPPMGCEPTGELTNAQLFLGRPAGFLNLPTKSASCPHTPRPRGLKRGLGPCCLGLSFSWHKPRGQPGSAALHHTLAKSPADLG